jgi:hypothetical protein
MRQAQETLRRLRHSAAVVLLGVFLPAVQVAPVAHLATHRPDHTHESRSKAFEEAGHDDDRGEHRSHESPHGNHGRESFAHFGVALLEGPPAPIVAPPAESIAAPPDARPRALSVTLRPLLPARGPPAPPLLPPAT